MTKIRNRQQLIDAAAKVFAAKGYEAARLEDIAAELGMLQGSLYYHVSSKAALLRLVLGTRFEEMISTLEGISTSSASPRDKLRQAIREQLRYIERYLPESPHWFTDPYDPRRPDEDAEESREMLRRLRAAWKSIVQQGVAAGDLKDKVDPSVTVLFILGMTNYVARWYDADGPASIDDIAEAQFELVWSGIARPAG
jgi:TetR/AcrR family transcriptional regulator, cholesterol catabolism regulator